MRCHATHHWAYFGATILQRKNIPIKIANYDQQPPNTVAVEIEKPAARDDKHRIRSFFWFKTLSARAVPNQNWVCHTVQYQDGKHNTHHLVTTATDLILQSSAHVTSKFAA